MKRYYTISEVEKIAPYSNSTIRNRLRMLGITLVNTRITSKELDMLVLDFEMRVNGWISLVEIINALDVSHERLTEVLSAMLITPKNGYITREEFNLF